MTIPVLDFNYKFSALSALYEIDKKSKFNFFIEIIAVVGAVITSLTFVHSFLSNFIK